MITSVCIVTVALSCRYYWELFADQGFWFKRHLVRLLLAIEFDVLICFRTASVKCFLPFLLTSLWLV
jgi:hypothetical protein